MNGRRKLMGQRIAVLVADGFEKVELTAPVAALRGAGAAVDIISLHSGKIRAMNLHMPAELIAVDFKVDDVSARDYDGLLIPGGFMNPDTLRQSSSARDLVRAFDLAGKPIATLCHGPWVLASCGLLSGRTLTSWPGVRDDMVHAGAIWLDQETVRDGNLVTSRGPQDIMPFVREMIALFAGEAGSRSAHGRRHSDPQRESPTAITSAAMRGMPRSSIGTVLGLALLGVGVAAAKRTKDGARMTAAEARAGSV
ncbi:type 1 glutamine amidotransferase domain-containing protein [Massilia niabensis]|uniref:Type 1 glutamine amidotransferase domain-containing protein n=1 Tax=Massilia niabensis TaxID=544910 RepID=A0ABW0L139_9BURK